MRNVYLVLLLPVRFAAALLIWLGVATVLLLYLPLEGWSGFDRRLTLFKRLLSETVAPVTPVRVSGRAASKRGRR